MSRIIRPAKFSSEAVTVTTIKSEAERINKEELLTVAEADRLVQLRVKELDERCQTEKEQAYRSGLEQGKRLGIESAGQKVKQAVDSFTSMVEDVKAQREELLKYAEEEVIRLALAIAGKIIGDQLRGNREAMLNVVRESINHLVDKSNLLVKVNPEDLELVREHRQDWLALAEGGQGLRIEADPSLSRGGCVIETDSGKIDARIERQLEILGESLIESI